MFLRKYFGMKAIKTLKPTPLLPTVKKANTIRCIPIDPVNGFLHIPQIPPDEKQLQQHIDESIRNVRNRDPNPSLLNPRAQTN